MKNYYDLLGVNSSSSQEEIKHAYKLLSQKFHPDKNDGSKFFEEMFKNINEAYSTLSNVNSRMQYDLKLLNTKDNIVNDLEVELDPLLPDAIVEILINKQASSSLLQRKLKLGYNRSQKIIDQIEKLKIISRPDVSSQRSILADKFGVVKILVENKIDSKRFLEYFESKQNENKSLNFNQDKIASSKKVESKWDTIKKWRRIANLFWILNLCTVLFVFLGSKYIKSSHIKGRIISPNGLYLRAEPSSTSEDLLTIPYNETISILDTIGPNETFNGKSSNWYSVEYQNTKGWVWGGYIE